MVTHINFSEPTLESIIQALCDDGYAVVEDFFSTATIQALYTIAQDNYLAGNMVEAKVGKNDLQKSSANQSIRNPEIRGDSTIWLDENSHHDAIQDYLGQMQALRIALNQALFLNLQSFETHFAIYPIGACYQRHLDQFANADNVRKLSAILYLNEAWLASDGGELRLYLNESEHLDISPTAGKFVLFLSDRFWHEVLPAKRQRVSVTGWFRTRENCLI